MYCSWNIVYAALLANLELIVETLDWKLWIYMIGCTASMESGLIHMLFVSLDAVYALAAHLQLIIDYGLESMWITNSIEVEIQLHMESGLVYMHLVSFDRV
jgi:hypothetical protein